MAKKQFLYENVYNDLKQKIAEGLDVLLRLYGRSEQHDLHQQIL